MKLPLKVHNITVANPVTIRDADGVVIAKFDTVNQDNKGNAQMLCGAYNSFIEQLDALLQSESHEQTPDQPTQHQSH